MMFVSLMDNAANKIKRISTATNAFDWKILAVAALFLVSAAVLVRNAWVGDDGYIGLRTVDNFVNGYGLRWNVDERVQTSTAPLWILMQSALYVFTREGFVTTCVLSLELTLAGLAVLYFPLGRSRATAAIGLMVLITSKTFVDYSVSGLENPLTFVLLAVFCRAHFKSAQDARHFFWLCLIACLGMLNRLDTALIFIWPLAAAWFRLSNRWKGLAAGALGFLPLVAWECFSMVYYGFPFPNSAYAKLGAGVDKSIYFEQGVYYFLDSLDRDPIALIVIAAVCLCFFNRSLVSAESRWKPLSVLGGAVAYLLYQFKIGGDFMSGRFFYAPLVLCVAVFCAYFRPPRAAQWALGLMILTNALTNPVSPVLSGIDYREDLPFNHGIADERGYYYENGNGLLRAFKGWPVPGHEWAEEARMLDRRSDYAVPLSVVGMHGFFMGADHHIIDVLGVGDPLNARLPIPETRPLHVTASGWRVGHYFRPLARGYVETIETGVNVIEHARIAEYYDQLCWLTRSNLFSLERWKKIWKFNTGGYDSMLDMSGYTDEVDLAAMRTRPKQGFPWNPKLKPDRFREIERYWWHYSDRIRVSIGHRSRAAVLAISLNPLNEYRISFQVNDALSGAIQLESTSSDPGSQLIYRELPLPEETVQKGYDSILIEKIEGPAGCFLGFVDLKEREE